MPNGPRAPRSRTPQIWPALSKSTSLVGFRRTIRFCFSPARRLQKDPERFDLTQWARDQQFANDVTLQIAISDKAGILTASNLGLSSTPTSISDREHFRAPLETDRDELFISKPVMGRVSGKWSIHRTRRINAADGSFSGIITVAIDPYYLAGFYESMDLSKRGMVLLAGLDGIVRARVSGAAHTVGQSINAGTLFKRHAQASS